MVLPDWSAPKNNSPFEFEHQKSISQDESLARPLDRLAAVIVDIFILLVPLYILLSAPFKRWLTASYILGAESDFILTMACMIALGIVLLVTYQALLHFFFSATLGKMLFDLRVQPMFRGEKLSLLNSFARAVVWVLELLCGGLPWLAVYSNSKRRTLHDRVCDSVVVTRAPRGVESPAAWERGLVRGIFAACLVFSALVISLQVRGIFERIKAEKGLSSLVDRDSIQCEIVSKSIGPDPEGHDRLTMAMTLYAAGLADRTCLEAELESELALQIPVGPITYLAQAFVNSDDAEVSNAYLDQVCKDSPDTVECSMSQVVSQWSEEDWKAVEDILANAKSGAGYLEVWAVRHYMKQAHYTAAIRYLDAIVDRSELAEFSLVQRVRALFNLYQDSEANVALAQALPSLPKEEAEDLSAWMCAQQLQSGCAALKNLACRQMQQKEAISEIDFTRTSGALSRVLTLECTDKKSVDYLTFSEAVRDEDWKTFFRANLKVQKDDMQAAFSLYSTLISSVSTPELLRIEATRRLIQFADRQQLNSLLSLWKDVESKDLWAKMGNMLLARFVQAGSHEVALNVAQRLLSSETLSPKGLAILTELAAGAGDTRQPASAPPLLKKSTAKAPR